MNREFDVSRTAVLAVDLQRENLREGAWPVEKYAEVLANARKVLQAARRLALPIIYTKHWLDPRGGDAMRHEPRNRDGRPLHSVAGDGMAEICEEVAPAAGDVVIEKQRFTAFYGTKLDVILRRHDIVHLIVFGVWTEACLETTVWDALWRDYRISLVKDACGSSTSTMHRTAILDLANWLFGGMIFSADELVKALEEREFRAWRFTKANAYPYSLQTIDSMYESI